MDKMVLNEKYNIHKGIEEKDSRNISENGINDESEIPKLFVVRGKPDFNELKGKRKGVYSVTVSGNWRITFKFDGESAIEVDLEDYH